MEIKINKEIRDYKENIFFGLSLRQFICSILAIVTAVAVYFLLKDLLGEETVSWLCIVVAAPIAAIGFFQYNGMNAEQFLWAWIKSNILCCGMRKFEAENIYSKAFEQREKCD